MTPVEVLLDLVERVRTAPALPYSSGGESEEDVNAAFLLEDIESYLAGVATCIVQGGAVPRATIDIIRSVRVEDNELRSLVSRFPAKLGRDCQYSERADLLCEYAQAIVDAWES